LGVTLLSGVKFHISLEKNRNKFYRSLNGILGKIGKNGSEFVLLSLIATRCVPCLTYGLKSILLNKTKLGRVEHPISRSFMKLFNTFDDDDVKSCQYYSGYLPMFYQFQTNEFFEKE